MNYELEIASPKVTTRMFTVRAVYFPGDLFLPDSVRVVFRVMKGKTVIGRTVTAMYGFEAGSKEVILEKKKDNHVTLLLEGEDLSGKISVRMLDAESEAELKRIDDIELSISI